VFEPGAQRRSLSTVDVVVEDPVDHGLDLVPQHLGGPVRRVVVHDDDLEFIDGRFLDRLDDLLDRSHLVVNGNDN
jgi:hypothetical protein